MTSRVETVGPTAGFKAVVERLRARGVSAFPVTDEAGIVLGVVSEADLLLKEERAALGARRRPLEGRRTREQPAKAAATPATALMTSPAVTIRAEAQVVQAARLMRRHGVKRLPVVDEEGRAVGIVSRCDLLSVFARDDEEIRTEIVDDMITHTLLLDTRPFTVRVDEGIVSLGGEADRRTDAILIERLAARVDGVVTVRSELTYRQDDGDLPAPRPERIAYPIRS